MKRESIKMTTAQFARLHGVNKRTLHYYDQIGLFTPNSRGENEYRYYDYLQSIDFEYIRMMKELNMEISEIKTYLEQTGEKEFLELADKKLTEIDLEIRRLQKTKENLENKKQKVEQSMEISGWSIRLEELEEERYLVTPFGFEDDDLEEAFLHVKDIWNIEQWRAGIGSYISVDKIKAGNFEVYDGLFTAAIHEQGEKFFDVQVHHEQVQTGQSQIGKIQIGQSQIGQMQARQSQTGQMQDGPPQTGQMQDGPPQIGQTQDGPPQAEQTQAEQTQTGQPQAGASDVMIRPGGTYLCGYQRGTWDQLPALYGKLLSYAEEHGLQMTGYAFEMGLNDFAISNDSDYVTKIAIKVKTQEK